MLSISFVFQLLIVRFHCLCTRKGVSDPGVRYFISSRVNSGSGTETTISSQKIGWGLCYSLEQSKRQVTKLLPTTQL